jgi:hypothetical protein
MTNETAVAAHHNKSTLRPNGEIIGRPHRQDELVLRTIGGDRGAREGERRKNGIISGGIVAEYSTISANHKNPPAEQPRDEPVVVTVGCDL